MTAHHFFAPPEDIGPDVVTLKGDEAHHAARSLRVRPGEEITVADGTGRIVRAVVTDVGDLVEAEVKDESVVAASRPAVTLFQALTKGDKIDGIVEKATEVGVRRIVPFVAERTIVKWDERKLEKVRDRWSAIAKAAAKQSRAPWIPDICAVASDASGALATPAIVLHEQAPARLRDVLPSEPPDELAIIVGPEGGLSDDEVERLRAGGAGVASLGPRVLRTETAGPVAAAVIAYHYGGLG